MVLRNQDKDTKPWQQINLLRVVKYSATAMTTKNEVGVEGYDIVEVALFRGEQVGPMWNTNHIPT